jgi:uncharacterized membrane protein YjgN (DUF898 family)
MSAMPPPPPSGPPPPPPPGGASPYGYSPYGGGRTAEHPQGTTVLVLGILSLVVCGLLAPVAWSMGNKALRDIDADPTVTYTNRGNITAGRICGIIGTCLMALGVVFVVIAVIAAAASGN